MSAPVHGCTPTNPERGRRGAAIGTRTWSLPAEHPSGMQRREAAARRLMRVVLSYGARLPGATEETAWRSPLRHGAEIMSSFIRLAFWLQFLNTSQAASHHCLQHVAV